MKKLVHLIIIIFFTLAINSCNKAKDPSLEKYFGTWKFTKTEYYWSYFYDPPNSYESSSETIIWEYTGEVSMGTQMGELEIQWSNSSSTRYFAKVENSQGDLSCVDGCDNIPYTEYGAQQNGPHNISETEYILDLGNQDLSSTQIDWDIKGVKQ